MNVLVTGSSGYIGSRLVDAILNRTDHICFGTDIKPPNSKFLRRANYNFFECDIRKSEDLSKHIRRNRIDVVFHLAGLKSVQESFVFPDLYFEVNTLATIELARICSNLGVRQFIFASSAAVYGNGTNEKLSEDILVLPTSPYGDSKLRAENGILDFVHSPKNFGMNVQILRYFNVIGNSTRWSNSNLVDIIWDKIRSDGKLLIYGDKHPTFDGTCVRDYIDIQDLVSCHLSDVLFNSTESSIYNLGTGIGKSVFDVVSTFEEVFKTKIQIEIMKSRLGEPHFIVADNSRSKLQLNFKNLHDLSDSIKSYL